MISFNFQSKLESGINRDSSSLKPEQMPQNLSASQKTPSSVKFKEEIEQLTTSNPSHQAPKSLPNQGLISPMQQRNSLINQYLPSSLESLPIIPQSQNQLFLKRNSIPSFDLNPADSLSSNNNNIYNILSPTVNQNNSIKSLSNSNAVGVSQLQQILESPNNISHKSRSSKQNDGITLNSINFDQNKSQMCWDKDKSPKALSKFLKSIRHPQGVPILSEEERNRQNDIRMNVIKREVLFFGTDPDQMEEKQKKKKGLLKKAMSQILVSKLLKEKPPLAGDKKFRMDSIFFSNSIRERAKQSSALTLTHHEIGLIRDLYYKVQAFISAATSVKRAYILIQQIGGWTPLLKRILFVTDLKANSKQEIQAFKQFKSLNEFEKEIQTLLQEQLSKNISSNSEALKEIRKQAILEITLFVKYLSDYLDARTAPDFSEAKAHLSNIKDILASPSRFRHSIDTEKQRQAYFSELMSTASMPSSLFTKKSYAIENIRSHEKDLGPFQMVTPFVREQAKQVEYNCQAYFLLS